MAADHLRGVLVVALAMTTGCGPRLAQVPVGAIQIGHTPARVFEHPAPRAVAILAPDLGFSGEVWLLDDYTGVGPELWRAGLTLVVLDRLPIARDGRGLPALPEDLAARLRRRFGLPVVAVGHGLGGTALAAAARREPFDAMVLFNAPLAFGGAARALRVVLAAASRGATSWRALARRRVRGPRSAQVGDALLSSELLPHRRRALLMEASAPLPTDVIRAIATLAGAHPVPHAIDALLPNGRTPALLLLAQADGWAPPWWCDPVALGARPRRTRRVYLARAHGHALDYGHLDPLAHPAAHEDVYPALLEWLDETLAATR